MPNKIKGGFVVIVTFGGMGNSRETPSKQEECPGERPGSVTVRVSNLPGNTDWLYERLRDWKVKVKPYKASKGFVQFADVTVSEDDLKDVIKRINYKTVDKMVVYCYRVGTDQRVNFTRAVKLANITDDALVSMIAKWVERKRGKIQSLRVFGSHVDESDHYAILQFAKIEGRRMFIKNLDEGEDGTKTLRVRSRTKSVTATVENATMKDTPIMHINKIPNEWGPQDVLERLPRKVQRSVMDISKVIGKNFATVTFRKAEYLERALDTLRKPTYAFSGTRSFPVGGGRVHAKNIPVNITEEELLEGLKNKGVVSVQTKGKMFTGKNGERFVPADFWVVSKQIAAKMVETGFIKYGNIRIRIEKWKPFGKKKADRKNP